MYKDRYFQFQSKFDDGKVSEPQIHRIEDIDAEWKMGRRGFLASTAVGLAAIGVIKNRLYAQLTSDGSVEKSECAVVPPHGENISGMKINDSSDLLATGSSDTSVKLWEFPAGKLLATFNGHTGHVWKFDFTHDSRYLFSSSPKDYYIKMWDTRKKVLKETLEGHTKTIRSIAVTPDDRYFLSVSEDKTLKVWSAENGSLIKSVKCEDTYYEVVFSPDSSYAFYSGWSDKGVFFDLQKLEFVKEFKNINYRNMIFALSLLPDGNGVTCSKEGLMVWDHKTGEIIKTYRLKNMECRGIEILPDKTRAVVYHYNEPTSENFLEVVSLPSFKSSGMISGAKQYRYSKITEGGKYMACVGYLTDVVIYNIEKMAVEKQFNAPVQRILCPVFSADGRFITFGGMDKEALTYSLPELSLVTCLADGTALEKGKVARVIEMKDSSGRKVVKGISADREKPSGSVCSCDTVIGKYVRKAEPSKGGGGGSYGGGSYCSCNRVCTCVPVK